MSTSIVIGNLVRGFTVIYGFHDEEVANTFVAENRKMIGSEYRLAPAMDVDLMPAHALKDGAQDTLAFERAKPGELVEPSTGASIDVQDHNPAPQPVIDPALKEAIEEDAQHPNLPDPAGTVSTGDSGSGASSFVPGLHSVGSTVAGPGQDAGTDQPDSDRAAGDGGEGDLANEQ